MPTATVHIAFVIAKAYIQSTWLRVEDKIWLSSSVILTIYFFALEMFSTESASWCCHSNMDYPQLSTALAQIDSMIVWYETYINRTNIRESCRNVRISIEFCQSDKFTRCIFNVVKLIALWTLYHILMVSSGKKILFKLIKIYYILAIQLCICGNTQLLSFYFLYIAQRFSVSLPLFSHITWSPAIHNVQNLNLFRLETHLQCHIQQNARKSKEKQYVLI